MSVLNENTIIGASAAGEYEIEQSLRFNDDDSAYLSRTPSSAGNRKTWTFSAWVKRGNISGDDVLFSCGPSSSSYMRMRFINGAFEIASEDSALVVHLRTTALFRDSSAWYHVIVAMDTTQSTSSNRTKFYINGILSTAFSISTYPSLNADTLANATVRHTIGTDYTNTTRPFDGYMGEVNFIDGQALTPDSFGETGTYGEWKPIAYAGTYGTNGFYLPFEQDYTVEGFSAVVYEGNGTSQYVGGVGFQPDFTWIKSRSAAENNSLFDSVRGISEYLFSNSTSEELLFNGNGLTSFDLDGFEVTGGSGYAVNTNSATYVAWNWDMGGTTASNTSGSITSSVRANTTYGQSIVSYSGTGSNATVGHGLASAPEVVILKNRDDATKNWNSIFTVLGTNYIDLNRTNATYTGSTYFQNTAPSSTVFSVGTAGSSNASSQDFIAYCFHSVTGYSKFGSYSGNGSTTGPVITTGFSTALLIAKRTDSTGNWFIWDSTRDTDGVFNTNIHPNSSAAEANSGSNFVTLSSTGFQLTGTGAETNASGGTYIYAAFADTREYAYWLDQSGNNNDWTSEGGLTESDVMVDSPTNNFATWNPIDSFGTPLLSEGNLKFQLNTARCRGTIASQVDGKIYFEVYNPTLVSNTNVHHMGLASIGLDINNASNMETAAGGGAVVWTYANANGRNIYARQNGSNVAAVALPNAIAAGDIIAFASDSSTGKVWMSQNNSWLKANGSFDGSNALSDSNYLFQLATGHELAPLTMPVGNYVGILNCGQDSSFAGSITPQGNQDSNGIGDFYYAPPTGFLALCTANLPSVDVIPSEHFNTVLYTGNQADNRSVTGVGFQPDFVWFKERSSTSSHLLMDAVRGSGKGLASNTTDADATITIEFESFDSDGFTVNDNNRTNQSGVTMVAWNWKAGGTAVSNTNGTITSSVSANPSAGFSIVTYTGNGTAGATVGHGLSSVPTLVIAKSRTVSGKHWATYVESLGNTVRIDLESTGAKITGTGAWNSTTPTSSLVTIGSQSDVNTSGAGQLMYCFHSVDGYSKVGSYTGNGSADGPFVHCGFKPAFVILKRTNSTSSWAMFDTDRDVTNVMSRQLKADTSDAENNNALQLIDFTSNGFKFRSTNGGYNGSASSYIFLAFAESPFKHSNAR